MTYPELIWRLVEMILKEKDKNREIDKVEQDNKADVKKQDEV